MNSDKTRYKHMEKMSMKKSSLQAYILFVAFIVTVATLGCGKNTDAEPATEAGMGAKAGMAVDTAASNTVEAAKRSLDAVKDASGQVVDKSGEILEKTGDGIRQAGENMQK